MGKDFPNALSYWSYRSYWSYYRSNGPGTNGRRDDPGRRGIGLGASRPISLAMKNAEHVSGIPFLSAENAEERKKSGKSS